VIITYTEGIEPDFSTIEVDNAQRTRVDRGDYSAHRFSNCDSLSHPLSGSRHIVVGENTLRMRETRP